ncbi:hypothetical protein [Streptomyces sp. NPDC002328]|uniref:hypothetical protein n=1 Tax=Streptomyces sp. NPDC002328 TaxID=3364642 RepID=UPI0036CBE458
MVDNDANTSRPTADRVPVPRPTTSRPSDGRPTAAHPTAARPAARHPADGESTASRPSTSRPPAADTRSSGAAHPADAHGARSHPTAARPLDTDRAAPRLDRTESRPADLPPTYPTPTATTQSALWITQLLQQLPELSAELVPGRSAPAHRPAPPPPPADLAARLSAERDEALLLQQRNGLVAPGHSAAPLRLYVSDALRDISDGVVELEEAVRDRLGLPRPRRAPVPERLKRISSLLHDIAADPVLAAHVRDETRRMARRCARTLGDTETVVRVSGRCPWCDSVSLRAFPDRGAVLCINPACRCLEPGCGCHDDPSYRHTWDEGEWEAAAR